MRHKQTIKKNPDARHRDLYAIIYTYKLYDDFYDLTDAQANYMVYVYKLSHCAKLLLDTMTRDVSQNQWAKVMGKSNSVQINMFTARG